MVESVVRGKQLGQSVKTYLLIFVCVSWSMGCYARTCMWAITCMHVLYCMCECVCVCVIARCCSRIRMSDTTKELPLETPADGPGMKLQRWEMSLIGCLSGQIVDNYKAIMDMWYCEVICVHTFSYSKIISVCTCSLLCPWEDIRA